MTPPSGQSSRPPEQQAIQALVTRAQAGDRGAFGELVRVHRDGVVNVVYRMCGNADVAEDAAQECFIRAWQNLGSYRPRSAFRNWLYRIATNCALTALRRERPEADIDVIPTSTGNPGPEALVEANERATVVRDAVLGLPEASRAVLVLREYEDLSYKEIAEVLDIPLGTVMSRLAYARRRLRDVLAATMEITR